MTRTYFYHLKFELYPTPTPYIRTNSYSSTSASPVTLKVTNPAPPLQQGEIYLPQRGADIFDSTVFPAHAYPRADLDAKRNLALTAKAKTHTRSISSSDGGSGNSDSSRKSASGDTLGSGLRLRRRTIIDCGSEHAQSCLTKAAREQEGAIGQITHQDSEGSGTAAAIQQSPQRKAKLAVEDWRFGRVRVESIDIANVSDGEGRTANTTIATAGMGMGRNIQGGPRSHSAKARFEPLPAAGIKNTEIGWGVVHLYRDGEESVDGMGMPPAAAAVTMTVAATTNSSAARGGGGEGKSKSVMDGGEGGVEGAEENTTILCIPAVPSYMTPSDFLGWVGEKTTEDVSHFRMVMTGRMNRYLVLLKFRDARVAKSWRAEWDGKVFGGLEVCFTSSYHYVRRRVANIVLL
jgi:BRCA1-associated protein